MHPAVIEIEINSNCNLSCSYCPNSLFDRKETGQMKWSTFTELVSQLKNNNYKGKIAFDFYNEPMEAINFKHYVTHISSELPESRIELHTNGTKIKSQKDAEDLIGLGISQVIITKHEQLKTLNIESLLENFPQDLKDRFVYRTYDDLNLVNRGGILKHVGKRINNSLPCKIPSLMLTVTIEGNVLPCFEDFHQTQEMGNINNNDIFKIWNNSKFVQFREDLLKGKREKYSICKECNRVGEDEKVLEKIDKHLIDEKEINAIAEVLKSGKLFRYQPTESESQKFEKNFSKKIESNYSLAVTSGTNALILALQAAKIGKGDEVIVPAYTFIATAAAVINVGAIPVVCEIDEKLCMNLNQISEKFSDKTKAIIPVHMDGHPCEIDKICKWAKSKNISVIEDCAQAIGGKFKNKYLGTFGDFGCFSFNKDKIITCGDGGLVTTNNRINFERLCLLSDSAFSISPHHKGFFEKSELFLGSSMRINEILSAMLNVQLDKLDNILFEHKMRKLTLLKNISKEIRDEYIIESNDELGDCGISFYIKTKSAKMLSVIGKELRDNKVLAVPVSMRPAHVIWKWSQYLGERSTFDERTNPYLNTNKKYNYHRINYLNSMDTIMRTMKIDIDINWSEPDILRISKVINRVLGNSLEESFENRA